MALKLGSKGEAVRALQQMLNFIGTRVRAEDGDDYRPLTLDGDFGPRTQAAVIEFQMQHGLLADGIVGPITMRALEEEYRTLALDLVSPGADSLTGDPERLTFERCPADPWGEGYSVVWLRSDVAERYRAVLEAVHAAGGILTSSGGRRDLRAPVTTGRSATSFHYTGRALDLFLYSGMVNPAKDPYVVVRENGLYHRVYARCDEFHAEVRELESVVTYRNRGATLRASGFFLDLTALFERHGFRRIAARPTFYTGGSELGAEWWHFQDETGLVRGKSTFGDELLKVYSRETLEPTPPWRYRTYVFGVNWN
ncbi:MAG: peptidoglycan-binding protein [Pseudomonadota bacterium]